jgi:hypothetical protein
MVTRGQQTVNHAIVGESFTTTGQSSAFMLQMTNTLPVLAINDTAAKGGPAA